MGIFSKPIRLDVDGMTCGNCVAHVTRALEGVPGVKKAKVDLDGSAQVTGDADPDALAAAVKVAGYDARVAA